MLQGILVKVFVNADLGNWSILDQVPEKGFEVNSKTALERVIEVFISILLSHGSVSM